MATHKITFEGGQQRDWSENSQPPNTFRDAVNMDFRKNGDFASAASMDGTELIADLFGVGADINVLLMERVEAQYDLDGDEEYEIDEESILLMTKDSASGSRITLVRLSTGVDYVLYDSTSGARDLAFPSAGTCHGFYERERDIPTFTWADDTNPLRTIRLRYSTAISGVQTPYALLWLRPPVFGEDLQPVAVLDGGSLDCGSYSFMSRFWSKEYCRGSAWSVPTNPIPITPDAPFPLPAGEYPRGGKVGEGSNRKVRLQITDTPGADYRDPWDSVQIIIIPYADGSKEQPTTGILLEPKEDWYGNPASIDILSAEGLTVDLSDYLVEDAPLIRAKSIISKDNFAIAGNISYNVFPDRPGTAAPRSTGRIAVDHAETIIESIDKESAYTNELDCALKRGHFREEQYAYGIAYYDQFGNFGPVRPLDLSEFWSCERHPDWPAGTNVDGLSLVIGSSDGDIGFAYEVTIAGTTLDYLISPGDVICFDGSDISWKAISAITSGSDTIITITTGDTLADASAAASEITIGGNVWKGYGQAGNQANNWAWKYPSRSDNQFSLLDLNGNVQAIGLRLQGIRNHPLWAKGFVVVRQARKKNILYQAANVPVIAAFGGITPGANASLGTDIADSEGSEYNTYVPKLYLMGHAADIVRLTTEEDPSTSGMDMGPVLWLQQEPHIASNLLTWIQSPEYMANRNGEAILIVEPDDVNQIRIVDAIAMRRTNYLNETAGENNLAVIEKTIDVWTADAYTEYYHSPSGLVYAGGTAAPPAQGLLYYYKSAAFLSKVFADAGDYEAAGGRPLLYPVDGALSFSLGSARQDLGAPPNATESSYSLPFGLSTDVKYTAVRFWNGGFELSRQQDDNPAIRERGRFTGLWRNQRGILLKVSEHLGDFTWEWNHGINESSGSRANAFPGLSAAEIPDTDDAIDVSHIPALYFFNAGLLSIPSSTVQCDGGDTDRHFLANFIVNVERGLRDDRYGDIGEQATWYSTGAVVPLTDDEVASNTPKDVDVWGGDCFISRFTQKISAGMLQPRSTDFIRDILDGLDSPTETGGLIDTVTVLQNRWAPKTGTFETGTQILEYFVETTINTNFFSQKATYPDIPEDSDQRESAFLKSWTYDYNAGYSAEPQAKAFFSVLDVCNDNEGNYPARRHFSLKRVYNADQTGLLDVFGYDRFKPAAVSDCNEKFGEITALVDNGGAYLHTIQEFAVRFDPINRDIVQRGNETELVLGRNVIGAGGAEMLIKEGCQHIRTVQSDNGVTHFVSAREGQVLSFGVGTDMWPISLRANERGQGIAYFMGGYFRDLLAGQDITELELDAAYDRGDRKEYWIIGRGWGSKAAVTQRFSRILDAWIGRFEGPSEQPIRRMCSGFGGFYALTSSTQQTSALKLWRMHTGTPGEMFGTAQESSIQVALNEPQDQQKTFDQVQISALDGVDTADMTVRKSAAEGGDQSAAGVAFNGPKNGWYRANRFRHGSFRERMRGQAAILTVRMDMAASSLRRVFNEIVYSSRSSSKNF